MPHNTFEKKMSGKDFRFALAVSHFNNEVTEGLLNGAQSALVECEVRAKNVAVFRAPGAFELPLIAQRLAITKHYDAIICLGAVIRGATPHFDYVAASAQQGILQVGLKHNLPVMFGVVTVNTLKQAKERSGKNSMNRGREAALAAVELLLTLEHI